MNFTCRLENAITEAKKLEETLKKVKLQSMPKDAANYQEYERECDELRWGILRLQAALGSFKVQMTPENLRKEEIIADYLESKLYNKIDTVQCEMNDYVDVMREQEVDEHVCNNIKDFQKDVVQVYEIFQELVELKEEIVEIKSKLKD